MLTLGLAACGPVQDKALPESQSSSMSVTGQVSEDSCINDETEIVVEQEPLYEIDEEKAYYVANCNEWVNFRGCDSTNGEIIGEVPFGAVVEYVSDEQNGFSQVKYNGETGYIYSLFLSKTGKRPSIYRKDNSM